MALSRSPAMLRLVRGLPQALFAPDHPLRYPSCTQLDMSCKTRGEESLPRMGPTGGLLAVPPLSRHPLPYWLGAEERLVLQPCPLKLPQSSEACSVVDSDISTAQSDCLSSRKSGVSRGFGSQAGALESEEEDIRTPAWRKQDNANGFITDGVPSQMFAGSSRCRSVTFGCATMQGKKETMDDRLAVQFSVRGNRHLGFFGAFDGHGGWSVADYAAHKLHQHMLNSPLAGTSLVRAMVDAYARTDEEVLNYPGRLPGEYGPGLVGSTATTAVVDLGRGQLVVGNVGDSRAVLSKGGRAVRLTAEHAVAEESERERIERAGGEVNGDRLHGILNVSRALGDADMKQWVISTPFVSEVQLTSEDDFIILATDGLWDVMSNEGSVEVAREAGDAQRAAQMLMEEAMMRRARDDVACLVVYFHWAR